MNQTIVDRRNNWIGTHYHRDARVISARKEYRTDLQAGVAEPVAYRKANAVYSTVRAELIDRAQIEVA